LIAEPSSRHRPSSYTSKIVSPLGEVTVAVTTGSLDGRESAWAISFISGAFSFTILRNASGEMLRRASLDKSL
jgi:hypothetical protein